MNIFFLDTNPALCAKAHCDKHVVKMILEYAQLLSTAHRIIDGKKTEVTNPLTGKTKKFYLLQGETIEWTNNGISLPAFTINNRKCYHATHINHPSAVWVRANGYQYRYLYNLFTALLGEYEHRYHKEHKCKELAKFLGYAPRNILYTFFEAPPQAMPDQYKEYKPYLDLLMTVQAYKNYYNGEKSKFAKWTNRERPEWFTGNE
jgi:hypothetical protein